MAKKRSLPYHIMPDGTMMPGATHDQYMQQEAPQKPVKRKGGKKAVKGKGATSGGKMSPTKPVLAPGKGKGGKGKGVGGSGKHNLV